MLCILTWFITFTFEEDILVIQLDVYFKSWLGMLQIEQGSFIDSMKLSFFKPAWITDK